MDTQRKKCDFSNPLCYIITEDGIPGLVPFDDILEYN